MAHLDRLLVACHQRCASLLLRKIFTVKEGEVGLGGRGVTRILGEKWGWLQKHCSVRNQMQRTGFTFHSLMDSKMKRL